jgi:hypothetical protein
LSLTIKHHDIESLHATIYFKAVFHTQTGKWIGTDFYQPLDEDLAYPFFRSECHPFTPDRIKNLRLIVFLPDPEITVV